MHASSQPPTSVLFVCQPTFSRKDQVVNILSLASYTFSATTTQLWYIEKAALDNM